jgi:TP901 family phage tail tape measure protein
MNPAAVLRTVIVTQGYGSAAFELSKFDLATRKAAGSAASAAAASDKLAAAQLRAADAAKAVSDAEARAALATERSRIAGLQAADAQAAYTKGAMSYNQAARQKLASQNASLRAQQADKEVTKAQTTAQEAQAAITKTQVERQNELKNALSGSVAGAKHAIGLLTVGVAAFGTVAIKMASSFQRSMLLVHTQAGYSIADMHRLRGEILKLAPSVGQSPQKLADALYHIASGGIPAAHALNTLRVAAEGAQVGNADLEQTTYALVSLMRTAPKDIHGVADAMGAMIAIVGHGDLRMTQLLQAMSTGIIPVAKQLDLGFRDVGAALDVMTARGQPAQRSAQRLRTALELMAAPSSAAAKILKGIGINSDQLAQDFRKPQGLVFALEDLKSHLQASGLTATQQSQVIIRAFGGARTSAAIISLMQNIDDLKKHTNALDQAQGPQKFESAWEKTKKLFAVQVDQMKASLDVLMIKLGSALIPVLHDAVKWFQHLFDNMANGRGAFHIIDGIAIALWHTIKTVVHWVGGLQNALIILATVWGVAKIGAFVSKMVAVVRIIREARTALVLFELVDPITAAFAIIGLAIGILLTHFKQFKRGLIIVWDDLQHAVGQVLSFILGGVSTFLGMLGDSMDALATIDPTGFAQKAADALHGAQHSIDNFRQKLDGLGESTHKSTQKVSQSFNQLKTDLQGSLTDMLHKYGDFHTKVGNTNADLAHGTNVAFSKIEDYIKTHTGMARQKAIDDLINLSLAWNRTFGQISKQTKGVMGLVLYQIGANTQKAAQQGKAYIGDFQKGSSKSLVTIQKDTGNTTQTMQSEIVNRTNKAAQQAAQNFAYFQSHSRNSLNKAQTNTDNTTSAMQAFMTGRTQKAANVATGNMQQFAGGVKNGMSSADTATNKGTAYILDSVSSALGKLGSSVSIDIKAVLKNPPKFARGGMVQFGNAGDAGPDNIPVNFGGQGIMVGSGEVGAVFTRHQKAVADQMMAPIGGMSGLFKNVSKPNHFATGGYVFPYPSGTVFERVDQGKDSSIPAGLPIGAIGPGRFVENVSGWAPNGAIVWQLTGGPAAGRAIYLGEHIKPLIGPGSNWSSGNKAVAVSTGGGNEMGWWSMAANATLAQATPGYGGDQSPQALAAGNSFWNFVQGLAHGKLILGPGGGITIPTIKPPQIKGGGDLGVLVQQAMNKETAAANKYIAAHAPVSTGGPGGAFLPGGTGPVEAVIAKVLREHGWNRVAIAGALGNSFDESSWNPASMASNGGGGLWGFLDPPTSIANLKAYAAAHGKNWTDVATQTNFMAGFWSSPDLRALNATGDPRSAAVLFERIFEKSGGEGEATRIAYAQKAYGQGYGKGGLLPPFGGSFADGGWVPGPVGAPRTIIAHGGEPVGVTAPAEAGPMINIENLNVHDQFDEQALAARLKFMLEL